ncbi:MAG TPA: DUF4349 domain-containing protein [Lachnospiraceae bacterium]|nr:DUF4349 domain-containing protein [Lachnospiraceae bacterium]
MRKRKILYLVALMCLLFTACSSKMDSKKEGYSSESTQDYATDELTDSSNAAQDYDSGEGITEIGDSTGSLESESTEKADTATTTNLPSAQENRKLIKRVDLSLETQDFYTVVDNIQDKMISIGGYAESLEMYGLKNSETKSCYLVARIPSTQLDYFVELVGDTGNVVSKSMSSQDVTLEYVDMESHVKTLKVERDRLLELITKAESLDDIIILENRLTEIRYELENYESRIKTYDNLVDYSTVSISIQEVERMTEVKDNKSIWDRMSIGLKDSLYDIRIWFENFSVGVITNLPYIIIWGAIIVVIIMIVRRKRDKIRKLLDPQYRGNSYEHRNSSDNTEGNSKNEDIK